MMRGERRIFVTLLAVIAIASSAMADERTDYLLKLLKTSDNYKVRVQAAATLGKLRKKEAVPALSKALSDKQELVVISAAAALSRIGDPAAIPALKKTYKKNKGQAVRSQIRASLRVLKAIESGDREETQRGGKALYLIRVDAMGNSSGVFMGEAEKVLKDIVSKRMGEDSRVVVQKKKTNAKKIKKMIAAQNLRGYIISGAVIRLERVGSEMVAKIALNVFTNPGYSLLMMPTAEGRVPISKEGTKQAQIRAIRVVSESLMNAIFNALENLEES